MGMGDGGDSLGFRPAWSAEDEAEEQGAASPMKMEAGLKLQRRKASVVPMRWAMRMQEAICPFLKAMAKMARRRRAIPRGPSRPSEKFTARLRPLSTTG